MSLVWSSFWVVCWGCVGNLCAGGLGGGSS